MMKLVLGLLASINAILLVSKCSSFSPHYQTIQVQQKLVTRDHSSINPSNHDNSVSSRRSFGSHLLKDILLTTTTTGIITLSNFPSHAFARQSEEDVSKEKLLKGYQRLNYLLENWVQETTICGRDDNPYITGKGGCERTPLKVMDYLGYKDINDPLFRADKTMKKLEPYIPNSRFGEYLEAMEKWSEAAEEGNGMAYISSWGESNPGGGKDRVQLFIERARKNVVESRDSLATIIDILDIK